MSPSRRRQANPHLGAYYGILTSAFVSLVISLAMFEQLGWQETWVARAMILVPLALYVVIALGARTLNVEDFFASGRRVPPVYNGAVLAAVLIGGTGFFAYTGTLFFLGFDALAIGLAWTAGLIVSGILFVPYLRKAGAYTMPAFLGQRFRSRFVRAMASVLQLPPAALLLAAEIKIAALIIAMFLPLSHQLAVACVAVIIACVTIVGGMRSLTWSASAQFIVSAVGFAVPLIIVSVLLTNLPAPQLTYGEMFEPLKRSESVTGVSPSAPSELATALPREQPGPSAKPFLQAFGAVSQTDFLTLFLCLDPWRRGAAEPACSERRHELGRRSAALRRLGGVLRGTVRHQRAGARRLRQAADVPGHCPSAGKRASLLAQRFERVPAALHQGRQQRWRHRGLGALRRARRHRARAAHGGEVAIRLHRAHGRGGFGHRACRRRIPSLHPCRQPRRRRHQAGRPAQRGAPATDGGVGGDRRNGARRRRVPRLCRDRCDAGRHHGLCLVPRRFSSRCCFSPSGGDAALGSAPCLPLASASPPWLPQ